MYIRIRQDRAQERESVLNSKTYSRRDEKRILDVLGRGLLKDFPNPERIGCPGADVLKKIASHKMPLSEAEKWLASRGHAVFIIANDRTKPALYALATRRNQTVVALTPGWWGLFLS